MPEPAESTVATRGEWERAAAAVLRKARRLTEDAPDDAVWEALTRRTVDGVGVPPLGTPDLVDGLTEGGLPGAAPFLRGSDGPAAAPGWDVRARVADPRPERASALLLADLEGGASSAWLSVGPGRVAPGDLRAVLADVLLDLAPVVLDAPEDPVLAARAFLDVLSARGVAPAAGTSLGGDPIGAAIRLGRPLDGVGETLADLARLATDRGIGAVVLDATVAHDRGASEVEELAHLLAAGAATLRSLESSGVGPDTALGLLEARLAATDEQFPTIAKLRAARLLWHRLTEASGVAPERRGLRQHVVTSRPMMTRYDPYVNLLRTTVATFAAGVGGAASITVLPFDVALGLPEAFSHRLARNISALLVSEAHVAQVVDPAGGAYAVERLTADFAEAAWALFQDIERAGGMLGDGWEVLAARIEMSRAAREEQVARRTRPITGVSEFPQVAEALPTRAPYPDGTNGGWPGLHGYADAYEALRDSPPAAPVFLATMGSVAEHTARATFMTNLLAAGGISTTVAGPTDGVEGVLTRYSGEPVVALAGADPAYADWGTDLVIRLRAAGARHVVIAGRPIDGVDDSAALGVDALAFLRRTRAALTDGADR